MKKSILSLFLGAAISAQAVEMRVALDGDAETLDPMELSSQHTLLTGYQLYDPLLRVDSNLKFEPRIAESWNYLDDKTIQVKVRQNVKFTSGNDLTADDVIWSFDRLRNSPDFKKLYENFSHAEKIDDFTVNFHLKEVYPLAVNNFSYLFIMDSKFYTGTDDKGQDKAALEKGKPSYANTFVSGSGAYIIESTEKGVKTILKKNPNYWDKNTGNVDRIILTPIKEAATRVSALASGDVDWIYPIPPTELERVEKIKDVKVDSMASDRIILLELNQKVVPAFQDLRVRQAVNLAINNQGIVDKIMRGQAVAAGQLSPQGYLAHRDDLKPEFDLEKAKQLMKEAGYENGFSITMISPNDRYVNDEKIAQAVVSMLARINIKAELTTMPKVKYWVEFDKCEAGIQLLGWSSDTGDSANYSEFLTATRNPETGAGQFNCHGNNSPQIDKLLADASKEVDVEKRKAILQEVSKLEKEEALFVPLHWQNLYWGYNNKLENFKDTVNLKNFTYFSSWKVKE